MKPFCNILHKTFHALKRWLTCSISILIHWSQSQCLPLMQDHKFSVLVTCARLKSLFFCDCNITKYVLKTFKRPQKLHWLHRQLMQDYNNCACLFLQDQNVCACNFFKITKFALITKVVLATHERLQNLCLPFLMQDSQFCTIITFTGDLWKIVNFCKMKSQS
jgi:hypothetical protein